MFAELRIPIIDAINLQLSARYEDYRGNVGSTFDPQARLKIELTDWLGIRGGVGTSFRGPPPQNLSGSGVSLQVIGTGFRAVEIFGNPNLRPESATTYNGGILIDRGPFNASLDYWRYDLKGPIESEPVSGLANALFGASGTANCGNPAFAALQSRFTFNAAGCGINNVSRLRTQVFNSADVKTSGLDFTASYRGELGPVELTVGGAATYVIDYDIKDLFVEGILVQPAFDATYRLALDTGTTFTLAAVNIFNRDPPFARLDPNYDSFTASPLGFTLKAAVSQAF